MGAGAFAAMLNRFYETATHALLDHNAMIDKMVGDEVMALYIQGPTGPDYRKAAVLSAVDLMRAMGTARVSRGCRSASASTRAQRMWGRSARAR